MPSSKGYKRDYHQEDLNDSPARKHQRVERNQARAAAVKAGKAHKGDGKDVDHIKPLSKGGSNKKSNTRVISASKNRSYPRKSSGAMK